MYPQLNNLDGVAPPTESSGWFAIVEHNKGTAVWVVVAPTADVARLIARNKAQSMYSGLDWDMTITSIRSDNNAASVVAAHEVRFYTDTE